LARPTVVVLYLRFDIQSSIQGESQFNTKASVRHHTVFRVGNCVSWQSSSSYRPTWANPNTSAVRCWFGTHKPSLSSNASHDQKRESYREEHNTPAGKGVPSAPKCDLRTCLRFWSDYGNREVGNSPVLLSQRDCRVGQRQGFCRALKVRCLRRRFPRVPRQVPHTPTPEDHSVRGSSPQES